MSISVATTGPSITVDGTGATVAVTVTTGGGSSGGVTDHGALTGLSDDDHTIYAKKASDLDDLADAATARTNLGLGTAAQDDTGDFAAASHNHAASDVTSGAFDAARLATGTATDTYVIASNAGTPTWTAAAGGGTMEVISDTTLGSAAASVSFTSIPATYASLRVVYVVRGDASATYRNIYVDVNGDTNNSSYNTQWMVANNASMTALATDANSRLIGYVPAATATTGYAGYGALEFHDYANTTFFKTAEFWSTRETNGAAANRRYDRGIITRMNTAAVTSLNLFLNTGNMIAGSRLILYGIGST